MQALEGGSDREMDGPHRQRDLIAASPASPAAKTGSS
jgi:hypothetical protein